jgi:acetylornithine deacetylase/succinyl-diaminopimelate desuccinylase-like protein
MRLVPDQEPAALLLAAKKHLKAICPPTVRMEFSGGHTGEPYLVEPTGPLAKASLKALKEAYGHEPVLLREGGSIPIVNDFKKVLGVETLLLGMGLPDDNAHSPNEKFEVESFFKGIRLGALLWPHLANSGVIISG